MWPSIQVDYADLSRPLTYADLVGVYALWPTSSATPQGVAERPSCWARRARLAGLSRTRA